MADLNVQIQFPKKVATNFGAEQRSLRERRANFKSSRDRIIRAINKDGGRYIEFNENEMGLLVCGVEYQNKLNFIFIDKDRRICCKHHGETYRLLREIPSQLSVLNYIIINYYTILLKQEYNCRATEFKIALLFTS